MDSASDEFSCQNAYFFAEMCEAAYSNREEVKTIFQGNETVTGMGFEHFKWFEVSINTNSTLIPMFMKPPSRGTISLSLRTAVCVTSKYAS